MTYGARVIYIMWYLNTASPIYMAKIFVSGPWSLSALRIPNSALADRGGQETEHNFQRPGLCAGQEGEYPEALESFRTTKSGLQLLFRPVKISDEPLLKDFFYSLSDQSLYRRFISSRKDMPHERLQEFVIIDYTQETVIMATITKEDKEEIVGVGQYGIGQDVHSAEVAFAVRDKDQRQGIGTELLNYLIYLGKRNGLLAFVAEVLYENKPMLSVFDKAGFKIVSSGSGIYYLSLNL